MRHLGGMHEREVRAVLDDVRALGPHHHVGGGWAAEALAGRVTRPHHDLDLFVDARAVPDLLARLAARGYRTSSDEWPVRVELTGPAGVVDVYPLTLTPDGDGVQTVPGGSTVVHRRADLTTGRLAGRTVRVPTPERQRALRTGYPPRREDAHDLQLLRAVEAGLASAAEPTGRVVAWSALLVAAITVATVAALAVVLVAVPATREHGTLVGATMMTVHGLACLLGLGLLLPRLGTTWAALGVRRPTRRLLHVLWQYPLVVVAVLLAQGLLVAVAGEQPSNLDPADTPDLLLSPVALVLTVVSMCVLAPLWEELFFRGVLLGALNRRTRPWVAVVASAAIFAAVHLFPPVLPYLFVLGVSLALLRRWHANLWAGVVVHALNNTMAMLTLVAALRG